MILNALYDNGSIRITSGAKFKESHFPLSLVVPDDVMAAGGDASKKFAFIDLKAQQRAILPLLLERIQRVLSHGQYIMGPEVAELEQKLAAYVGAGHAIACSSGTDALLMPLLAYGVGPGDAIFTTPFTFIATAEVIQLLGATPVFVDIDPKTFNMAPSALEEAVASLARNPKTASLQPKGIIPVDLFGLPAEYDSINATAAKHGLFVLEDAAQSFGATYHGRRAGSLAEVAATSFFPAKPLGGYGDGGAIFTNDAGLAEILRSIRVHGEGTHRYDNVRIGLNGRLDTLQAAILLAKLEIFDQEISARQDVAGRYHEGLGRVVQVPVIPAHSTSVWAQYSVISPEREAWQQKLKDSGIPTAIYYPRPLHLQGAFAPLGYQEGAFPVSEWASRNIFSLPMHPYLNETDQGKIMEVFRS
jgi:UDP-2-acetamido-2-deoxy-ribo-hexuluronate aminotransferase